MMTSTPKDTRPTETVRPNEITRQYFLTAGETEAEGRMPMWLIVSRAIEIATEHANILGIGYSNLKEHGIGWVLTRMTVQMLRYPIINDTYSLTTWIEGYNRLYSDRCFVMTDASGEVIGHIRSQWVAIDMEKRTAADLTAIERDNFPLGTRVCPLPMQKKLGRLTDDARTVDYTFKYSDLDFNRHVNTVQYVKHLLNQWSLEFFDDHQISLFEIAFHQECHYGETVQIRVQEPQPLHADCEIVRESRRAIAAIIEFKDQSDQSNLNNRI